MNSISTELAKETEKSSLQFTLFVLLFMALNFHILRNLHIAFLALPAFLYALLFLLQFISGKSNRPQLLYLVLLPFTISLIYVILLSIIYLIFGYFYKNLNEVLIGASRFLSVPLLFFGVTQIVWTKIRVEKILLLFSLIAAGGSLTLPYQMFFGEITWFAESSFRAGLPRYAPLFGSLTTIGMVAPIGIITTLFLENVSKLTKSLLLTSLMVGLALSLQKAAVANVVFAILLALVFSYRGTITKLIKPLLTLILVLAIVLSVTPELRDVASVTVENFRLDNSGVETEDDTVGVSLVQRTIELPHRAISSYGYEYLLPGVGMIGSAGAFGFPEAESTHNSLSDSLLTGGVLNFSILLWLICLMGREIMRPIPKIAKLTNNQYACARSVYCLILLNLPFVSGILFQPNAAILFYFFLGLAAAGYFRGDSFVEGNRRNFSKRATA